jgi:hypothetical protein
MREEEMSPKSPCALTAHETSGKPVSGAKLDNVIIPGSSQHVAFTATAGAVFR